jgi:hypothetical protein
MLRFLKSYFLGYYSKNFWFNPMPPIHPSQPLSGPLKAQQGLGVGLQERHLYSRINFKLNRAAALAECVNY